MQTDLCCMCGQAARTLIRYYTASPLFAFFFFFYVDDFSYPSNLFGIFRHLAVWMFRTQNKHPSQESAPETKRMSAFILAFEVQLLSGTYKGSKMLSPSIPPLLVFLSLVFSLSHPQSLITGAHTRPASAGVFKLYPVKPPLGVFLS